MTSLFFRVMGKLDQYIDSQDDPFIRAVLWWTLGFGGFWFGILMMLWVYTLAYQRFDRLLDLLVLTLGSMIGGLFGYHVWKRIDEVKHEDAKLRDRRADNG